ncbi:hypothetical protein HELRODRAFT_175027 [Helobdella robusta]|uniref:BACK domain-containing protein n=1 Tax=Helobdella robusta TaxID=6412 RepID=T1F8Q8_HELRO|nr:hypothetical protein HELRODRAFT_175027 [Helobdella robusta]ESO01003.1 hypothetical protein HELRODRAFT_175027 [Helobdella robusta]
MKKNEDDLENKDGSTAKQIVLISKTGGRHQVERNIFHQTSGYFQKLLKSEMKDANCRELSLKCLTNESLIEVRNCLSKLSSNEMESLKSLSEVEAGLDGAYYLLINDMIDSYIDLLMKHLNKSTCIHILDIADKYVLINQVVEKVIKYMLKNVKELSENSKMLLSPEEMFRFVGSEMDVFNFIIKWILEDQSRKCFTEKLLTEVRYSLMTPTEIQKCTAILHDLNLNINYDKDNDSNISRTDVDSNCYNFLPVYDFVETCKNISDRTGPSATVINPTWRQEPHLVLSHIRACVLDNCLYLVEEKWFMPYINSAVHSYNPVTKVWSKCCSMHIQRLNFYLGGLDGHLYAVAGTTYDLVEIPTVEKYIPSENRWHMVEPLPLALEHVSEFIEYQYDPSYNKRFSRAPMLTARCCHVMTSVGYKIFVVGGQFKHPDMEPFDEFYEATDGEMYDAESDQWSSVVKLKSPVWNSPFITINNCLYTFHQNKWNTFVQKINLAKLLNEKKTSNDSSLSSMQDRNANNNNGAEKQNYPCVDALTYDDCQLLKWLPADGTYPFDCQYVGVMVTSDV